MANEAFPEVGKPILFEVLGQSGNLAGQNPASLNMWLDLSIALSCAVAGLACGWVMRAVGFLDDDDPNALVTRLDSTRLTDARLEQVAGGRISEVASRLHDYATTMAMDVDAHQSRVQAVNNTLQEHDDDGTTEAVYQAVDELIAANDSMQEKLRLAQERIQEQAAQLESAEQKAHTDGLTRIANRRAFDDHLDAQFDKGTDEAGTLAILDVDHFKQFNDTYGHRAGDEVLRVVASILNARLHPYGIAARFGGEEFAIVLDGVGVEAAAEIVEHARVAIGERDIHFAEKRLRVTMSCGLAELAPAESKEQWLQRADDGLYHSKDQGRDCAHWMDGDTPIRIGKDNQHSDESDDAAAATTSDEQVKANDVSSTAASEAAPEPATTTESGTSVAAADKIANATTPPDATTMDKPSSEHDSSDDDSTDSGGELADESNSNPITGPHEENRKSPNESNSADSVSDDGIESKNRAGNDLDPRGDEKKVSPVPTAANSDDGGNKVTTASDDKLKQRNATDNSGPRAFNYLPDAEALAEAMSDLHQRSQTANIPLHVMAIRFDSHTGKATTRALLQIVRATLRSVDRIGCDDECTLLVCMPNLDADSAFERGQQICQSAASIASDETEGEKPCQVNIGLADAADDVDFAHVVSRVKHAADEAKSAGNDVKFAEKLTAN